MSAADPSVRKCPSCGAPVLEGASTCNYCQAPLAWDGVAPTTPSRSVRDAAAEWARAVFGAPRSFPDLIQSVQVHDEQFHRIFTTTVRRDVFEQRVATTSRRSQTARVDPDSVDPFAISVEALRADSEHVTSCAACSGSGTGTCSACGGSGRSRCPHCGGSGQERRYYKKTSRLVKCSVCRATGTVGCGACAATGAVTCQACGGSGHQLAWLAYEERSRGYTSITPESPVFLAHPQLLEQRALASTELEGFGTLLTEEARGPLQQSDGIDASFLVAQTSSLDPRLERIAYQQYLRIAAVRRDATYEMCGTTGVLVLSGANLRGSRTADALRPIHRRLVAWIALSLVVFAAIASLFGSLLGRTAYFDRRNNWLLAASGATSLLGSMFIGAVLRALRPGFRFGKVDGLERALGAGALAALCGGLLVFALSRPSVAEAQKALAGGNVAHARLVVDALRSTKGDTVEVLDAEDAVTLAEAQPLTGDARLQAFDKVAARNGTLAKQAAEMARAERVIEVRKLIDDKLPSDAIRRIDQWWPGSWKIDPDVAELRAKAEDEAYAACPDDPCRYSAAVLASGATATADRSTRVVAARQTLISDLTFAEVPGESTLSRLQRLRVLAWTAALSTQDAGGDQDVAAKATAASTLAASERAKVALVGADEPVAAELIGSVTRRDAGVEGATVEGVLTFLSIDGQKKCRGVYLVGPAEASRSLEIASAATVRLLSQAVGHPATIKKPATGSTSRWTEGWIPVVGRWADGTLVELRIGDATP